MENRPGKGTARMKAKRWAPAKCVQRTLRRLQVQGEHGGGDRGGRSYLYGLVGAYKHSGVSFECHKTYKVNT